MSRQAIQDSVDFFVLTTADLTSDIDDLRVADGTRSWVRGAGVQHGLWCLDQTSPLPLSPFVVATMSGLGRWIYFGSGFVPPPPPAAGFPYEFIFRPAEPFPAGNVYASWALLVAAAAATLGSKLVYFDDTLAPCSIPAGAWDFGSPTTFIGSDGLPSGSGGPNTTPLTIDDGATLAHVFEFRSLDITSDTTTSVILTPLFGAHYYLSGTTRLTQADPAGTFLASGTGFVFSPVVVTLKEFAEIATGAGPALSVTGVGANISVVALDDSSVKTDTIASVIGGFPTGSTVDSASISTAQAGVPGGLLTVALLSIAARVFYDDTLFPPLLGASEVQAAIDALKGMSSPWTRTLTVTALNAADTEVNPFGDDATAMGKSSLRWASITVGAGGFSVSLGGANPTSLLGSASLAMGPGGGSAPDTRIERVAPSGGIPQVVVDDNGFAGGDVNVIPVSDSTSKLGTRSVADGGTDPVSVRWEEVNTVTINTGDLNLIDPKKDAHWTIIEERDRILVLNRKTGKRYAMALTPIDDE